MPPPGRRRFDTDEDLRRKIDELSIIEARLGEPQLDAREALYALADERDGALAEAPPARKPTYEELARDFPPLPQQRPVPPKPDFSAPSPFVEYQRDDNPPPVPVPADPNAGVRHAAANYAAASEPPQEMGPPAPEDVIASARDPFDPRDPAPPVYTPPPEPPPEQEAGAIPEEVAAQAQPSGPLNPEAEHARAAARALAPRAAAAEPAPAPAPGQAPPPGAPASGPDYSSVAGRVASTPQQGENPDPFGHDDDGGFRRAEAIRKTRALYAQQKDDGGHRWEDEFLSKHRRIEDEEIRRRAMVIGIIGGYDRARMQANDWRASQQAFDTGLAAAQERDRLEARVPIETAEALAASGQISPEAAAQMRNNSGLLKQFGQFASQGGRAEHLDYQRDKMMLDMHTKIALQEELLKSLKERQGMKDETQTAVAKTYAGQRKQAEQQKRLTPEEHANLVGANLAEKHGLPLPVGKEAARGNYANVPPELREKVEIDVIRGIGQSDIASARKIGTDVLAIPAKADEQAKAAAKKAKAVNAEALELYVAKRKADPQFRLDYITAWDDRSKAVGEAWQGWKQMSEQGKAALTQWAGEGFAGSIQSAKLGARDGALAAPIQKLINELVKERSGATVTDQEWGRLGREVGLASGSYEPFKGMQTLENFILRTGQRQTRHRQTFEKVMGGWEKGP